MDVFDTKLIQLTFVIDLQIHCHQISNVFFYLQLITEQAPIALPRGAEIEGKCGSNEAELRISWINNAYTFRIFFLKVGRDVFITSH